MTLSELHYALKHRTFKLTNHLNESCLLQFTEIYVIKDNNVIADYEIIEFMDGFKISFKNVVNGDLANVPNILFVNDNFKTILNFDGLKLQQYGRIDCFLIGI